MEKFWVHSCYSLSCFINNNNNKFAYQLTAPFCDDLAASNPPDAILAKHQLCISTSVHLFSN